MNYLLTYGVLQLDAVILTTAVLTMISLIGIVMISVLDDGAYNEADHVIHRRWIKKLLSAALILF